MSEARKERHKDDIFYDMNTEAEIEGKITPIHITLVKHNTGRIQFYNHVIVKNEEHAGKPAEPVSSNEALGFPPVGVSADNITQTEDEGKTEKPHRIFKTQEEAARDLRAAFGISEEQEDEIPKNKFVDFFDDSDENIERLKAKWAAEMKKMSAMPMFNPKLWTTALELGGIYLQRGVNKFADWARQMTNILGKDSKIWHSAVWETLKTMPEKGQFDDKQIAAIAGFIGSKYEDGITSLEEIQKDFEKNLGAEGAKKISAIVEASFKGIEKFFAENVNKSAKKTPAVKNDSIEQNLFDEAEKNSVGEYKSDEELQEEMRTNYAGVIERIDSRAQEILKNLKIKISKSLKLTKGRALLPRYYAANEGGVDTAEGWETIIFVGSNSNEHLYIPEEYPEIAKDINKILGEFNIKFATESLAHKVSVDSYEEAMTLGRALNLYFGNYKTETAKDNRSFAGFEYEIGNYIEREIQTNKYLVEVLKRFGAEIKDGQVIYPSKETQAKIERTVAFMAELGAIKSNSENTILTEAIQKKNKISEEKSAGENSSDTEIDRRARDVLTQVKEKLNLHNVPVFEELKKLSFEMPDENSTYVETFGKNADDYKAIFKSSKDDRSKKFIPAIARIIDSKSGFVGFNSKQNFRLVFDSPEESKIFLKAMELYLDNSTEQSVQNDIETEKAAVKVTGDEFGEYEDLKELRQKAKDFYKQNLRGTSVRNPILGEVELTDDTIMFTNSGLNKMGATSAQEEKILLVRHLPELIEKADKISSKENIKDKRNASQYSYLHSTAEINGNVEDVNITIFTDANGNKYYNHNIVGNVENEEDLPVHSAQVTKTDDGIPTIDKSSTENISQSAQDSKQFSNEDKIDRRVREALKAAGLEGKIVRAGFVAENRPTSPRTVLLKKTEDNTNFEDIHKDIGKIRGFFDAKYHYLGNDNVFCYYLCQTEDDAISMQKALNIYLGNEEGKLDESGKLGESGRTAGGYQVRESAVRETAAEGTRREGNDKISEETSGQERRVERESEKRTDEGNAGNSRLVTVQSERTESGGTGERIGTGRTPTAVQSAAGTERGSAGISANAENVEYTGHNYKVTDDSEIGTGGLKGKFKQNIDAIKLLKQLESEGRKATPSEQKILAKFNGWGTLASAFTNDKDWQKENQQLREILTEEEYQAARAAITNAFFTSPKIAQAMWSGLQRLGFKGGKILDPSMGNGIFFGTMPNEIMARSELTGVEKDSLTGRIAQQLYQKAAVDVMGFEERKLPNNYFDVAITNVPFNSDVKIYNDPDYRNQGYNLHNFFFAKALDKVRPGGFVVFITSQDTMQGRDAQAERLRAEIDGKADLIAAYKLPNTAFEKNAGTQVTSDILILQKRLDPKKTSEYAQTWRENELISADDPKSSFGNKLLPVNEYFSNHYENMIGEPVADWRGNFALDGKERNIEKELADLISKLPENIFVQVQGRPHDALKNTFVAMADSKQFEGAFSIHDGKLVQKIDNKLVEVPKKITVERKGKPVEIDNPALPVIRDFLKLQQSLDNVLMAQLSPETTDAKLSELRQRLNRNYDEFIKKHGYLNSSQNAKFLSEDPNYGKVAAIEIYRVNKKTKTVSASKGDIFHKRTATPNQEVTSADNSLDALSLSLSKLGRVDMDYMKKLTGRTESEIVRELGDLIYRNPETNLQELAEEYLSGNVREKLQVAREAARNNSEYKRNVEALEKVQPIDLTEKEISPHLGAPWIAGKYYEDFVRHMIDWFDGKIKYDGILGEWRVDCNRARNGKSVYTWGVPDTKWDFENLLEAAMNKNTPVVTKDKKVDVEKTAEVKAKIERIKEEFEKWIWQDADRKQDLIATYNKIFNSEVLREYNGAHLKLKGVGLNEEIRKKLYPHQKDAIWRLMQGKNTLLAHAVGAGKTFEMQIAAMEMKRIGLIKKPLFVVPKNILKQFERDFRAAYCDANLLVLTADKLKEAKVDVRDSFSETLDTKEHDDEKKSKSAIKKSAKEETAAQKTARLTARRKALSQIAMGDWDGIIITHDMFMRLPMSPQTYNDFYREQIEILEHALRMQWGVPSDAVTMNLDKRHQKALENAVENLKQKLKRDTRAEEKEIVIPFEELGIDQIFVDEADMFKNLGFQTRYSGRGNNVAGVSTTNALRSHDMYLKTKWLTKQRNGGGVCFATGTPISNTLNEIYTMQRYLDAATLEEKNCRHFDGWAGTFCKEAEDIEVSPDGNGFRTVIRLNLTNLQSLIKMFKKFADIKMAEDMPHIKRPRLKNKEYTRVQIEPTEAFKKFKQELLLRAEAVHKRKVDPREDNMLKITGDFRKASLDMRLIDPTLTESEAGGKIETICDTVFAKYKETADVKGAQLIFSDLSTPKGKKDDENEFSNDDALNEETSKDEISVYDRIKKGLVKRGIPANQIAFVHDAKNDVQRQNLFERVNEGDIRVIIGSTSKMGAGTNFQKHLVALHHIDCPWRPRDIEQREGRILRSGNLNEEVEIFTYVTKGSYDANMWEKVAQKAAMIDALMRGDPTVNELEDISKAAADYQEIAATAFENPLMSEQAKISSQVRRLNHLKYIFDNAKKEKRWHLRAYEQELPVIGIRIENLKADIEAKKDTTGDNFKIKIGDTIYTKRGEATAALDKTLKDFKNLSTTKIGEIGGFEIKARAERAYSIIHSMDGGVEEVVSNHVYLQLENNGVYSVDNSIQSMEHFINKGILKALAQNQKTLDNYTKTIAELKKNIAEPFNEQAELDEAEKRLAEIQSQLSKDKSGKNISTSDDKITAQDYSKILQVQNSNNIEEFEKSGQKIFTKTVEDEQNNRVVKMTASIDNDNQKIIVAHQADGRNISYSIELGEIDKLNGENKDIEPFLTGYFSQALTEKLQRDGELTPMFQKIQGSTYAKSFGGFHKELVGKMYDEFRKYVPADGKKLLSAEENYPAEIKGNRISEIVYDSLSQDKNVAVSVSNAVQEILKQDFESTGKKVVAIRNAVRNTLIANNVSRDSAEQSIQTIVDNLDDELNFSNIKNSERGNENIANENIEATQSGTVKPVDNRLTKIAQEINSKYGKDFKNVDKILEKTLTHFTSDKKAVQTAKENDANMFRKAYKYDEIFEETFFYNLEQSSDFEKFVSDNAEVVEMLKEKMFPVIYENLISDADTSVAIKNSSQSKPNSNERFEVSEILNQDTGEKKSFAKLKEKVDDDEQRKLVLLAREHGGSYAVLSKRFAFDTAENRDAFIKEALGEKFQSDVKNDREQLIEQTNAITKQLQEFYDDVSNGYGESKISERDFHRLSDEIEKLGDKIQTSKFPVSNAYKKLQELREDLEYCEMMQARQNQESTQPKQDSNEKSETPHESAVYFGSVTKDGISVDHVITIPHSTTKTASSGEISAENRDAFVKESVGENISVENPVAKIEEEKPKEKPIGKIESIIVEKESANGSSMYYEVNSWGTSKISKKNSEFIVEQGRAIKLEDASDEIKLKIAMNRIFSEWERLNGFSYDPKFAPKKGTKEFATHEKAEEILNKIDNDEILPSEVYEEFKNILNIKSDEKLNGINDFIAKSNFRKPKGRGKWKTLMSSPSREELKKLLKKELGAELRDDNTWVNYKGEIIKDHIREHNGRWQYGYYEDNDGMKFSGKGDLKRMFAARKEIPADKLNSWQKKFVELGDSEGLEIVWIKAHKDLQGAMQSGRIYINSNANENILKTYAHEEFHLIAALNPTLHNDLLEYFAENKITATQIDNYRKKNNREDLTDAEVIDEILADNFGQIKERVKLLQEMAAKDTSLLKRLGCVEKV